MAEIEKILPQKLDDNATYSIRVRTVNALGVDSPWSDALVVDTNSLPTVVGDSRLNITKTSIFAYNSRGELSFGVFGDGDTRTNLVTNPSFELATTGWNATTNTTISRSSLADPLDLDPAYFGDYSLKLEVNSGFSGRIETSQAKRFAATAGQHYTATGYIYIPEGEAITGATLKIAFYNASNQLIAERKPPASQTIAKNGEWERINSVGLLAPPETTTAALVLETSTTPFDSHIFVDGLMVENGHIIGEYFDGSTAEEYQSWIGDPHDSASLFESTVGDVYIRGGVTVDSLAIGGSFFVDTDGNMWSGNANFANADFSVSSAGHLKATGVDITGTITATSGSFTGTINATSGSFTGTITAGSGTIGGWLIGPDRLSSSNTILNSDGNITLGTSTNVIRMSPSGTWRFWIGHSTATSANFRVNNVGVVTASGMTITGASTFSGTLSGAEGSFSGTISSSTISATTFSGGTFSGSISMASGASITVPVNGTITGGTVRTAATGNRVSMSGSTLSLFSTSATTSVGTTKIVFNNSGTGSANWVSQIQSNTGIVLDRGSGTGLARMFLAQNNWYVGFADGGGALDVSLQVTNGSINLNKTTVFDFMTNPGSGGAGKIRITFAGGQAGISTTAISNDSFHCQFINSGGGGGAIIRRGTAVEYSETSDLRMKEEIEGPKDPIEIIKELKPKWFKWKGHDDVSYGFYAQEAYESWHKLAYKGDDSEGGEFIDPWMMDKSNMVPFLVYAVQELLREVEDLKNQ